MTEARILVGNCLDRLRDIPAGSIQCVVTSPPYYALRDYGDDGQDWPAVSFAPMPGLPMVDVPAMRCPLGLEPDPWAYVGHIVLIWREVRRVMRSDAVCWLNLGDSYGTSSGSTHAGFNERWKGKQYAADKQSEYHNGMTGRKFDNGTKPKDILGIPWRVAFALQADGWWLRSDVVWAKPNPMPESVTDRPTKAHEYVFLLAKSARYFWDADAVREENSNGTHPWTPRDGDPEKDKISRARGRTQDGNRLVSQTNGRNIRTVWTITTKPYPGAHFAVMSPDLAQKCIKAATSERGCCPECGRGWGRVVHHIPSTEGRENWAGQKHSKGGASRKGGFYDAQRTTAGWAPSCSCDIGKHAPMTVLDPFGGAGTTALEAMRLGHNAILCEQSAEYAEKARSRILDDLGRMFSKVVLC